MPYADKNRQREYLRGWRRNNVEDCREYKRMQRAGENYRLRESWTHIKAIHYYLDFFTFRKLLQFGYTVTEIEKGERVAGIFFPEGWSQSPRDYIYAVEKIYK